jgi:hypothetical protein
MRPTAARAIILAAVVAAGCGSEPNPGLDASPDAGHDLTAQDQAADTTAADTTTDTSPDTLQPDAVLPDTVGVDAPTPDLAPVCKYLQGGASDTAVVKCGSTYKLVLKFTSKVGPPACPPYWTVGGVKSTVSATAAAAAAGCSTACLWKFSKAVLALHCGKKLGFEVLVAPGCKDLYKYPDGYYDSPADYAKSHPCP